MMKKIAILYNNSLKSTFNLTNKEFNNSIINNIGNLVFINAIKNIIKNPKVSYSEVTPEELNSCGCLIVPAANWISSNLDLSGVVGYLKQIKIPIIFLGLGIQANNYLGELEIKNLHDSSINLINLIKEKNCIVGCRGAFTQDFLHKNKINSTIIGCVSNLINNDANLKEKLDVKWNKESKYIVCLGNDVNTNCPVRLKAERTLFSIGVKKGFYVQQSYLTAINSIRQNNLYADYPHGSQHLKDKIGVDFDEEEFKKAIINNTRFYVSIEQWMEDVAKMDLCFGTRIHGNILAMQSQCPSIVVYHDSRTKELAETMSYPRISVEEFVKIDSIQDLKYKSNCNFDSYFQKRQELKNNLSNMLYEHGVFID